MDSVQTMGVITGDIDNDGYRELFFTTGPDEHNYLLYNNGNSTFKVLQVQHAAVNNLEPGLSKTAPAYRQ